MTRFFLHSILMLIVFQINLLSQVEYKLINDISYYSNEISDTNSYIAERCKLNLYYPTNLDRFATVVWFHGGGLRAGEKLIPEELQNNNLAVVAVNYRLFPKIKSPKYVEDAAASVAWVFNNISKYGGDTNSIFVSGHSAGGYLTSMIGMDKSYLAKFNIDADKIAGLIPFSGHTITHFTVREEMGIPGEQPIIDNFAPLYFTRKDTPPIILITGDRNLEMLGRYEENAYFYRMLKVVGNKNVELYEIDGHDHVEMVKPAFTILLKFIKIFLK